MRLHDECAVVMADELQAKCARLGLGLSLSWGVPGRKPIEVFHGPVGEWGPGHPLTWGEPGGEPTVELLQEALDRLGTAPPHRLCKPEEL